MTLPKLDDIELLCALELPFGESDDSWLPVDCVERERRVDGVECV